ncbi:MAG: ABC transporter permease [Candidatus Aminicenantales bacterium]
MREAKQKRNPPLLESTGKIFSLFFFQGKRSKKTKVFLSISIFPVLIALAIKFIQSITQEFTMPDISIFNNIIIFIYLQFLILILSLFYGTSVCSDEIEGKTLTYLTTRPVPKSAIILGKYGAYTAIIALLVNAGIILSFLIININQLAGLSNFVVLLRAMGVLTLGLICYTAFFTMIGTFLKKSILFGLVFSFGWENVIQYFPGSTQRFVIVHYLKSLLPQAGGQYSFLMFRLEPTPPGVAVGVLILLLAVFLALSCLIFTQKEYILED